MHKLHSHGAKLAIRVDSKQTVKHHLQSHHNQLNGLFTNDVVGWKDRQSCYSVGFLWKDRQSCHSIGFLSPKSSHEAASYARFTHTLATMVSKKGIVLSYLYYILYLHFTRLHREGYSQREKPITGQSTCFTALMLRSIDCLMCFSFSFLSKKQHFKG